MSKKEKTDDLVRNETNEAVQTGSDLNPESKSESESASEQVSESEQVIVAQLEKTLEAANQKAQENWDLYLRAKAEQENIRRRSQLDVQNAHQYGFERFAKELLSVLDSLERGLVMVGEERTEHAQLETMIQGIELTQKLFLDVLKKFDIEPIDPKGELFDPKFQEALTLQPNGEVAPNTVLEVIQKGYRLRDRILRSAQVIVSK